MAVTFNSLKSSTTIYPCNINKARMLLIVCRPIVIKARYSPYLYKARSDAVDKKALGIAIRIERVQLGISQEELAHKCGLH